MAKKIVTVFIRDTSINLLEMRDMRVQKWASLPLEPGLVSQGVVEDEDQVAARIKELFNLEKISDRKVIAGMSGLNSLYRLITLPELPEAIRDEAVRREAERVMPVSLDEVYLSYQHVPSPKGEIQVFLAVFPRNGADALLRTLRKAGLEPYLMDLAPLALCRIPNEPREPPLTRLPGLEQGVVRMGDELAAIIDDDHLEPRGGVADQRVAIGRGRLLDPRELLEGIEGKTGVQDAKHLWILVQPPSLPHRCRDGHHLAIAHGLGDEGLGDVRLTDR